MTNNLAPVPYAAYTVTLPLANTAYPLRTLLEAVDPNCPLVGREVNLQAAIENSGTIKIGDSALAAGRYGYALQGGDSRLYRATQDCVIFASIWVMGDAINQVISVEVMQ